MKFRALTLVCGALGLWAFSMIWSAAAQTSDVARPSSKLLAAAYHQVGVTTLYDPNYTQIAYPGGDVVRQRGVCTDVVIRAYRDAFGLDLQKLVHEDMQRDFQAYPHLWGLLAPDANIDHRRVPNLQTFFRRKGRELAVSNNPADYAPGDIATQSLPGRRPHIVVVSDLRTPDGARPLVVHNIGAGAKVEDSLFAFPITGHYRFGPGLVN